MLRKIINKHTLISIALCALSAILLAVSFSFANLWILAWVAFIPLFIALDNQRGKKALFLSYITGILFWSATVYWLINVTLLGFIILVLYLAVYFGFFGFIISRRYARYPVIFIPSLWVVLEYIRSHLFTGFPWAVLGYSQYLNLPFIQAADIAGVWLISFAVMLINVLLKLAITRKRLSYLLVLAILVVSFYLYGFFRLRQDKEAESLNISVIQGNIPQEIKWDPAFRQEALGNYLSLTTQALKDSPDLIIWPEASLPVVLEEEPAYYFRLKRYVKASATPLIFGAVTSRGENYYNSAILLSGEGRFINKYDKLHLVPFGEYVPFRKALGFLETVAPIGDITHGKKYVLFKISRHKSKIQHQFGVLICFEDVFPELGRNFVNDGADFLVSVTNDAWFGKTPESYQHLSASVFRAVENRVNVVRSANTGVSGFINQHGRIISLVQDARGNCTFVPGYKTQNIFIREQPSFYGAFGDFIIPLCLFLAFSIILFSMHKRIARIIILVSLLAALAYLVFAYYTADKYYFLCPIKYNGSCVIRSDPGGDGSFASSRNGRRIHQGIDLLADTGTPVLAVRSGLVISAKRNRGMGNFVILRHSPSLITIYGHLSRIDVVKNQCVRQGEVIGAVGKTGNARNSIIQPHLHFEIRKNGVPQNPLEYLD